MERLPIWLSAVGERTAGPGTADMSRFPLHGMRQLRLPMALIERPVQGHSTEGEHWCTTAGEHGGENGMLLLPL